MIFKKLLPKWSFLKVVYVIILLFFFPNVMIFFHFQWKIWIFFKYEQNWSLFTHIWLEESLFGNLSNCLHKKVPWIDFLTKYIPISVEITPIMYKLLHILLLSKAQINVYFKNWQNCKCSRLNQFLKPTQHMSITITIWILHLALVTYFNSKFQFVSLTLACLKGWHF